MNAYTNINTSLTSETVEVKLKHRLAGAVIIMSLAIIILPLILDGSEQERIRITSQIPNPPKVELEEISITDVVRKIKQMEQSSKDRLPKEVVDETDYRERSDFLFDKNNLPVNWSIQIGSFESEKNAVRLRERLRSNNYRTYVLHAQSNEGGLYRVFVGPSSSKAALTQMMGQIEASHDLKGRIVRYRIEEDRELLGG